jgi:hypothetical protein
MPWALYLNPHFRRSGEPQYLHRRFASSSLFISAHISTAIFQCSPVTSPSIEAFPTLTGSMLTSNFSMSSDIFRRNFSSDSKLALLNFASMIAKNPSNPYSFEGNLKLPEAAVIKVEASMNAISDLHFNLGSLRPYHLTSECNSIERLLSSVALTTEKPFRSNLANKWLRASSSVRKTSGNCLNVASSSAIDLWINRWSSRRRSKLFHGRIMFSRPYQKTIGNR